MNKRYTSYLLSTLILLNLSANAEIPKSFVEKNKTLIAAGTGVAAGGAVFGGIGLGAYLKNRSVLKNSAIVKEDLAKSYNNAYVKCVKEIEKLAKDKKIKPAVFKKKKNEAIQKFVNNEGFKKAKGIILGAAKEMFDKDAAKVVLEAFKSGVKRDELLDINESLANEYKEIYTKMEDELNQAMEKALEAAAGSDEAAKKVTKETTKRRSSRINNKGKRKNATKETESEVFKRIQEKAKRTAGTSTRRNPRRKSRKK